MSKPVKGGDVSFPHAAAASQPVDEKSLLMAMLQEVWMQEAMQEARSLAEQRTAGPQRVFSLPESSSADLDALGAESALTRFLSLRETKGRRDPLDAAASSAEFPDSQEKRDLEDYITARFISCSPPGMLAQRGATTTLLSTEALLAMRPLSPIERQSLDLLLAFTEEDQPSRDAQNAFLKKIQDQCHGVNALQANHLRALVLNGMSYCSILEKQCASLSEGSPRLEMLKAEVFEQSRSFLLAMWCQFELIIRQRYSFGTKGFFQKIPVILDLCQTQILPIQGLIRHAESLKVRGFQAARSTLQSLAQLLNLFKEAVREPKELLPILFFPCELTCKTASMSHRITLDYARKSIQEFLHLFNEFERKITHDHFPLLYPKDKRIFTETIFKQFNEFYRDFTAMFQRINLSEVLILLERYESNPTCPKDIAHLASRIDHAQEEMKTMITRYEQFVQSHSKEGMLDLQKINYRPGKSPVAGTTFEQAYNTLTQAYVQHPLHLFLVLGYEPLLSAALALKTVSRIQAQCVPSTFLGESYTPLESSHVIAFQRVNLAIKREYRALCESVDPGYRIAIYNAFCSFTPLEGKILDFSRFCQTDHPRAASIAQGIVGILKEQEVLLDGVSLVLQCQGNPQIRKTLQSLQSLINKLKTGIITLSKDNFFIDGLFPLFSHEGRDAQLLNPALSHFFDETLEIALWSLEFINKERSPITLESVSDATHTSLQQTLQALPASSRQRLLPLMDRLIRKSLQLRAVWSSLFEELSSIPKGTDPRRFLDIAYVVRRYYERIVLIGTDELCDEVDTLCEELARSDKGNQSHYEQLQKQLFMFTDEWYLFFTDFHDPLNPLLSWSNTQELLLEEAASQVAPSAAAAVLHPTSPLMEEEVLVEDVEESAAAASFAPTPVLTLPGSLATIQKLAFSKRKAAERPAAANKDALLSLTKRRECLDNMDDAVASLSVLLQALKDATLSSYVALETQLLSLPILIEQCLKLCVYERGSLRDHIGALTSHHVGQLLSAMELIQGITLASDEERKLLEEMGHMIVVESRHLAMVPTPSAAMLRQIITLTHRLSSGDTSVKVQLLEVQEKLMARFQTALSVLIRVLQKYGETIELSDEAPTQIPTALLAVEMREHDRSFYEKVTVVREGLQLETNRLQRRFRVLANTGRGVEMHPLTNPLFANKRRYFLTRYIQDNQYHVRFLKQVLPALHQPSTAYPLMRRTLTELSLALENSLKGLLLHFDIEDSEGVHLLWQSKAGRSLVHRHNLEELCTLLNKHLEESQKERLPFSEKQRQAISKLANFIGTLSRYRQGARGDELTKMFQELSQGMHTYRTFGEGWQRVGEKHADIDSSAGLAAESIMHLQRDTLYPLILDAVGALLVLTRYHHSLLQ
jgi:hypothetical protein